jgi:phenylacetic acid degradation operon negative regulatory protein
MSQATERPEAQRLAGTTDERPLTARSVIASTLLGMRPPRLPTAILVRSCGLFGITEGTTRVAVSRMVAAGELHADDGGYRLTGSLLDRQDRQEESRHGPGRPWDGQWTMAVVVTERRSAPARAELRDAVAQLRLAPLREGVWLRPDNLPPDRLPSARAVVDQQCQVFTCRAVGEGATEPSALAASLWDLDRWSVSAVALTGRIGELVEALESGDLDSLAPGFLASAAVLRHLQADPLLPAGLLPPDWPGDALRADYDRYDVAFKQVWRAWYKAQRSGP